jgi:hypothetical protein
MCLMTLSYIRNDYIYLHAYICSLLNAMTTTNDDECVDCLSCMSLARLHPYIFKINRRRLVDVTSNEIFYPIYLFYTDPHNALSHVWNAASHANPPHLSGKIHFWLFFYNFIVFFIIRT